MRKILSLAAFLLIAAINSPAQTESRPADIQSLVEAERGFARTSVEKGTREAFLSNLADDAVVFQPRPVNGKKWWTEQQARPGVLSWKPVFAFVSRAGDLGYTTGPWEFRPKSMDDKPVAYGYFVTIWKRQAGGVWKAILDLGTRNPEPQSPAPDLMLPGEYPNAKKAKAGVEAERASLLKTENDFLKLMGGKGGADSFLAYMADDFRYYRQNSFPVSGKEAARSAFASRPGTLTWQNTDAGVSTSGDLGYTYGTYEFKSGANEKDIEDGNYMRIWRKQPNGKWRVVLDLLNPIPKAAK